MLLLITACGRTHLTMKEAASIVLQNEADGSTVEIADAETVKKITGDINALSLKKGKTIQLPPGWTYHLIWRDTNEQTTGIISIVDESTIGYNDHYYSVSEGSLDMDFFDELFDDQP